MKFQKRSLNKHGLSCRNITLLFYFYIHPVNTHCHADHITGTGKLKERLPDAKSIISKASGAKADIYVDEGDQVTFGDHVSCLVKGSIRVNCWGGGKDLNTAVFY